MLLEERICIIVFFKEVKMIKPPNSIPGFGFRVQNPTYSDDLYLFPTNNQEYKKLGNGGREWQIEAANKGKDARFFFNTSFCGSGKTFLQIWLAIHDIVRSGYKQKQLITVPQSHIGHGFANDGDNGWILIEVDGKKYEWSIAEHNFCDEKNQNVLRNLKKWLLTDSSTIMSKQKENVGSPIITGLNAVVSHQALGMVWKNLKPKEKDRAIKNLTLRGDEAHKISGVFDFNEEGLTIEEKVILEEEATILGKICCYIFNSTDKSSKIHLTTATPFRGNNSIILSDAVRKKFVTYILDFIRHWKSLGIKYFDMQYEQYDVDPIDQVVNNIEFEPYKKHLIVVPSTNSKWRRENELKRLFEELYKIFPKERVLDLVTQSTQSKNKQLLLAEPKNGEGESKFDVVVTCMLGREGTDWCPCSRLHNLACENSLTLAVQTIGRLFRSFLGKKDVQCIYYVKRFAKPTAGMTKRELFSDRTNAIWTVIQLDDMFHPILLTKVPVKRNKKEKSEKVSLAEVFGDQYPKVVKELVDEFQSFSVSGKKLTKDEVYPIVDRVIKGQKIEEWQLHDVRDGLVALLLRRMVPEKIGELLDISFLRKNGFDKIIKKYSLGGKNVYCGNYDATDLEVIREILDRANSRVNNSVEKKKKLLEMARNGEDKPYWDSLLGYSLVSYISKYNDCYDVNFANEIKKIRPDWFISNNFADENKKKLLEMACNGEDKPHWKSSLRLALKSYTSESSGSYSYDFANEIKKIRPDWFIPNNFADENKKKLLEMARKGENKPIQRKHPLGSALNYYICKSSKSYDSHFIDTLIKINQSWIIHTNTASEKKKKLLEMVRKGENKPIQRKHPLGSALLNYTCKSGSSYDPEFDRKIRKTHWFNFLS